MALNIKLGLPIGNRIYELKKHNNKYCRQKQGLITDFVLFNTSWQIIAQNRA